MRDRNVHAVGVVVGDVLPVDRARTQGHASLRHEFLHSIGGELIDVRRSHLAHARQAGFEAHEHEAHEDFLLERREAVLRCIEVAERLAMRHADEPTVERIGPRVIRAGDAPAAAALRTVEQARCTMATHVVKAANLPIVPAHDERPTRRENRRSGSRPASAYRSRGRRAASSCERSFASPARRNRGRNRSRPAARLRHRSSRLRNALRSGRAERLHS